MIASSLVHHVELLKRKILTDTLAAVLRVYKIIVLIFEEILLDCVIAEYIFVEEQLPRNDIRGHKEQEQEEND